MDAALASHQVEQVSLDPVFPAAVFLLPLLDAHQLVSVPGDQRLTSQDAKEEEEKHRPGVMRLICFIQVAKAHKWNQTHHDFAVVQGLGLLLKLHPHGVVDLVVPEGAQRLGLEFVAVLHNDFGLMQVDGDLPGSKVDVCKGDTKSEVASTAGGFCLRVDFLILAGSLIQSRLDPSQSRESTGTPVNLF